MISSRLVLAGMALLLASCATGTIAQLKSAKVDLKEEKIEGGLDKAIQNYQIYLEQTPESGRTPESIRRLADLKVKKELETLDKSAGGKKDALPARGMVDSPAAAGTTKQPAQAKDDVRSEEPRKPGDGAREEIADFEKRTTAGKEIKSAHVIKAIPGRPGTDLQSAGTQEAIALYKKLLNDYPNYEFNDQVLYQLARTYEEQGNVEEAMKMMNRMAKDYPHSRYIEEVQFRRGEYHYARKNFSDAKAAYKALVDIGAGSPYYELALYKLGWTCYKQDQYEEGLNQFVRLLDHKIAAGNDLEHPKDSFDEKRIEDIFRVMSLSFSNLGGADAITGYFGKHGKRTYETNAYKNLGDHYLDKRRYGDAAATFKTFVKNNPYHKMTPYFDIWAIDSYRRGGFSKLVIESNKEFIANYGLKSAYWSQSGNMASSEVTGQIKTSLKELANFYHAHYQDKLFVKDKDENFKEAVKWYREFLGSFPKDASAPIVHFQLADLLLENKLYDQAAIEYEHVAYDYPAHEKSGAAGYAAIFALRGNLAFVAKDQEENAKRVIIRNSLKFSEAFPKHEKAALVMSAAIDDIYGMKQYSIAAATARKLLSRYSTEQPIRRAAWLIFAHSSFELGNFKDAEEGYLTALGLTAENDVSRAGLIENLAASFYRQGEQANKLGDYRKAATYFLLVGTYAPTAKIRPTADFDGATALIRIKAWDEAANVMRSFQANYPGHVLQLELAKKLASAYKEAGELLLAAAEYERIGVETKDAEVRRAALELAGDLYYQAKEMDKAYPVFLRYLREFPKPLEYALEIHKRIAMYLKTRDDMEYLNELKKIVEADVRAGPERTSRTRYLGATAALELADLTIKQFAEVKLVKPVEKNLLKKKAAMMAAKEQLDKLFEYEMDEATSAATYYLAEMYSNFSRILLESERPYDLNPQEKEQYELSIEEQAYPFEEKAIQVHQKNLELMSRGIYNSWIEKSMEKLAKMVPARYAKFEESSGFINAIDTVSYAALIEPISVISDKPPVVAPPAGGIAPNRVVSPAQK